MGEPGNAVFEVAGYSGVERIGQGGVGIVYRAIRRSTGGTVAIKVLRDVSDESVVWHRTRRELTALVALAGHANVIQLVEQVDLEHDGERVPALVMEYAPGGSVADLLSRRDDVLTVGEAVLVGEHTAAALVAAHAQGIVHRDIKPQNLLIDAYGQVKLCDFGIASLTHVEGFETRTNAWSMRYASPEDLDDDAEVGAPSDVYSLGATLLHLVHGAPPTLKQRLVEWVPPPDADQQSADFDAVLAECLDPIPERRPTAVDLLERLEQLGWTLHDRQRALAVESVSSTADADRAETGRDKPARVDPAPVVGVPDGSCGSTNTTRGVAAARFESDTSPVSATDETLLRSGRRLPRRPEAESTVRRRWPVVVSGIAVIAVVCLAAVMLWPVGSPVSTEPSVATGPSVAMPPSSDDAEGAIRSSGPTASSSPVVDVRPPTAGVAAQVAPVQSADLAVPVTIVERPGGLIDIADDRIVWPFGDVGECLVQFDANPDLQSAPCDDPHDLERIWVAELDAAAFPDDSDFDQVAVQASVDLACREAAESFVGPVLAASALEVPMTRPSAGTWNLGDRRFQCLLGVPHHRIVGSAALRAG